MADVRNDGTVSSFHVEASGPPLEIDLGEGLSLTKISVGPMDNNAYLLRCGDASVLIDAANDADRLLELIGPAGVGAIVTTHRHWDHLQALKEVAAGTGAGLYAGTPDAEAVARDAGVAPVHGLWDGDAVPLGPHRLGVLGLVGHTPGSIIVELSTGERTSLFTGDSLFPGGPGKTANAQDFTSLMDDLERKVFDRYDDDTVVHPGHGDSTTLGAERPHLAEWRARGW